VFGRAAPACKRLAPSRNRRCERLARSTRPHAYLHEGLLAVTARVVAWLSRGAPALQSQQIDDGCVIVAHGREVIGHASAGNALVRPTTVGAVESDVRDAGGLPIEEPAAPVVGTALAR